MQNKKWYKYFISPSDGRPDISPTTIRSCAFLVDARGELGHGKSGGATGESLRSDLVDWIRVGSG